MGNEKFLYRLEQPHGSGNIYISWQKSCSNYMATAGIDSMVNIFNRNGKIQERIKLPGFCTGFEWDFEGDFLGIVSQSSQLILWDSTLKRKYSVDLNLKDTMTCIFWAKGIPLAAIGTVKGNICLYDHTKLKCTPIIGKHSKRITCGGWNSENILVLGSEDKTLSLSNADGDTLKIVSLRSEPSDVQFSEMKVDERIGGENTISLIIGKKTLYLYNILDHENPIELAFQQHYGNLVTYRWFGDGYILLGFSFGYFIAISTHIKEVGQELFQIKNHKNSLNDIALCRRSGKVASCGDNNVKIHDTNNLQGTSSVLTLEHETGLERIAWSDDGQLLAVCTINGSVNVYVSNVPLLTAVSGTNIIVLSNLAEVNLYTYFGRKTKMSQVSIPLETEPTIIAIGPYHMVAGSGNKIWFYDLTKPQPSLDNIPLLLKSQQYDHDIVNININAEYVSVHLENKIELNMMEPATVEEREYALGKDWIPMISAVDGAWSKRFFRTTTVHYLVWAHKKMIFIGVGNKYCAICAQRKFYCNTKLIRAGKSLLLQWKQIEPSEFEFEDRQNKTFPEGNSEIKITCHALTTDFLIYGTDSGQIVYFHIEDWTVSNTYNHTTRIAEIYPDPASTRVIFIDSKNQGYVYNAVNGELISIPDVPSKMMGVVWNSGLVDKNVFIVFDDSFIHVYISGRFSINGVLIEKLNEKISLLSNQIPLLMNSEEIVIATPNGHITTALLDFLGENFTNQQINFDYEHHINKHIEFQKFSTASKLCSVLKSNKMWLKLAEEALKYLEIKIALQAYKNIGNIAMVSSLERISNIEDKKLLAGYCSMFLKDYNNAQRWFLSSEYPQAALQMEKDLLHWDHALDISKIVAPDQIPLISREYAQQLEFIGNYSEAYILYEKGLADGDKDVDPEHIFLCKCGTARTTIRCGNYKQGFIITNEVNKKELYLECADILMSMKQFLEAAVCYEKARMYDKAASAYIKVKNWKKVEELLTNVTSNKIHVQYARAKEAEGKYDEAIKSYYTANDINSVIRLQLDYLNDPTTAVELATEIKSIEGFKMVASFFQRINDYSSAVKYLILSNSFEEAYELAKKHKILYLYGDTLIDTVPLESIRSQDFNALASHFEQERNSFLAGKFYFYGKEYNRALDLLLKSSKSPANESQAISLAIDIVASSNDKQLGVRLVDFLLGETDGVPKDPKHLFRLYMAQKKYKDAAKSAIIIANEEQINGNYKNGRDILFNMYQELKMNEVAVPYDMYHNLMLLHSYILVRIHVKKGDHMTAARLLVRVAENISKFPSHTLPILTSTVIECHRANLKKFAYKYATMLVQNSNYRKEVDSKYVRKIESIVRKMPKNDLVSTDHSSEPLDPATACPYCGTSFPEMEILCPGCKSNVPVCIVTGRHITAGDLTICHECQFPALKAKFLEILDLEEEKNCPMCQATVDPIKLESIAVSQLQI